MEPGHEDREYAVDGAGAIFRMLPQWSPAMKTGNTGWPAGRPVDVIRASMEPGHEDREYPAGDGGGQGVLAASMEPGHEDREYDPPYTVGANLYAPQWSPAMKTGNTTPVEQARAEQRRLNGARP